MFHAAHLTYISVYPFFEPVFAPGQLTAISRWQRCHSLGASQLCASAGARDST